MGPQYKIRVYVGFDSLSIIRFLKSLTDDVFKTHFDENIFPSLRK